MGQPGEPRDKCTTDFFFFFYKGAKNAHFGKGVFFFFPVKDVLEEVHIHVHQKEVHSVHTHIKMAPRLTCVAPNNFANKRKHS